jgi:two-component system nitrogen regulation response regulator GlnG
VPKTLTRPAIARLQAHDWPGNVRELENLCWRLAALAPGDAIGVADLEAVSSLHEASVSASADAWELALADWARARLTEGETGLHAQARAALDRVLLDAALEQTAGHRGEAAARLGLGRNTLTRKLGPGRKRR